MPDRRTQVILATKIEARKADDALRQLELSLKRLQTDRLDVLHIHAMAGPEDAGARKDAEDRIKRQLNFAPGSWLLALKIGHCWL